MIELILLTLAWIGAVSLDIGSTLRFVNRWGWKWEGNYFPRIFLKYFVQTGKWRYEIAYIIFYMSLLPLLLLFYPSPFVQFFYILPLLVLLVGLWNLFIYERINKWMRRGAYCTIFGQKTMRIKTWKLSYRERRIKKFDS